MDADTGHSSVQGHDVSMKASGERRKRTKHHISHFASHSSLYSDSGSEGEDLEEKNDSRVYGAATDVKEFRKGSDDFKEEQEAFSKGNPGFRRSVIKLDDIINSVLEFEKETAEAEKLPPKIFPHSGNASIRQTSNDGRHHEDSGISDVETVGSRRTSFASASSSGNACNNRCPHVLAPIGKKESYLEVPKFSRSVSSPTVGTCSVDIAPWEDEASTALVTRGEGAEETKKSKFLFSNLKAIQIAFEIIDGRQGHCG
ncbi:hypothetical protein BC829DRAFT_185223 [Chytridium lagenaria]|nr:hypothetical protein BC829DRAFT_185223 [Chytridium lagenaria]